MRRVLILTLLITLLLLVSACSGTHSETGIASAKSSKRNSIKLTKSKLTMTKGTNKSIRLKGAKASKVRWSSSKKSVASVSKGKIKAKKPGKATITAKYKGKKYRCKVTVKSKKENPVTEPEQPASEKQLKVMLGSTEVNVEWSDNESVTALKELVREKPLTIQMSMYGGFEQVGPIGTRLPRNDKQTTTNSGDIVLYSGDQIVVFYGSNSWSYTRLGHITDKTQSELKELLGNTDITLTISIENE